MSITAVPILPISKGSLTKLWVGVGALVLAAGGLAYAGQAGVKGSASGFMAKNAGESGVITTKSGLQYKIVKDGAGPSPTSGDVTLVSYKGTLTDGTVFDQNEQAAMPVDGVVPGFAEALQLMKRGGEYKLWLPPELAYGDKVPEGGPIPPNAVLTFDVKLLDFKSKAEIMQMQQEMQRMQMQGGAPAGGMPPHP
jgi:FKBP-type peptidyl-prolyl cis-trans isomerase FkpA